MFDFFKKKKSEEITPFDAALKRLLLYHKACMLFLNGGDYQDEGKADLAKHLYFLGAVDCASQMHTLSDDQFIKLTREFFSSINSTDLYATLLLRFFVTMDSTPAAMKCVIEGGKQFNKWMKGNEEIPICSVQTIMESCENSNFPSSIGQLYMMLEGQ